jgi:glycine amidinotransferase
MLPMKPGSRVSSYNEWDPLEEIVVGTARGSVKPAYEPASAAYHPPGSAERARHSQRYGADEVEAAERQLDHFVAMLQKLGVTVTRPDPIDQSVGYATPNWTAESGTGQTCPRDLLMVIGSDIIEAPMAQRARFFEYLSYRRLLNTYFRAGARWTAAPKPTMADRMYVDGYSTAEVPYDFDTHPNLTEEEPCFDAASFIRCGRDIFWQPDLVTNQAGADWLGGHLGSGFRLHPMQFLKATPHHIDTTLVPLRPGLMLTNPDRPFKYPQQERLFSDNGWRLVQAVPSVRPIPTAVHISSWISMNLLSLDEHTVVIETAEEPLAELLGPLGFDVIRCPFDRVIQFGGSFHCCTLDVRRNGTLQSYFPALDASSP